MHVESVKGAKLMIEARADYTLKDASGKTALDYASEYSGNEELIRFLQSITVSDC